MRKGSVEFKHAKNKKVTVCCSPMWGGLTNVKEQIVNRLQRKSSHSDNYNTHVLFTVRKREIKLRSWRATSIKSWRSRTNNTSLHTILHFTCIFTNLHWRQMAWLDNLQLLENGVEMTDLRWPHTYWHLAPSSAGHALQCNLPCVKMNVHLNGIYEVSDTLPCREGVKLMLASTILQKQLLILL